MNVCGGGSGPSAFFGEGVKAPLLSPFLCDRGGDARLLTSDLTLPGIFCFFAALDLCPRLSSPKALRLPAALESLKLSFAAFFEANYYEDQFRQSLSHALAAHWSKNSDAKL